MVYKCIFNVVSVTRMFTRVSAKPWKLTYDMFERLHSGVSPTC